MLEILHQPLVGQKSHPPDELHDLDDIVGRFVCLVVSSVSAASVWLLLTAAIQLLSIASAALAVVVLSAS